jgi:hypothetical protein
MKKYILICMMFVLISIIGSSQTYSIEKTSFFKAGTAELVNGKCTITIERTAEMIDYFVQLTSIDKFQSLYISKKDKDNFEVYSANNVSGKFDYIIYIKESRTIDASKKK